MNDNKVKIDFIRFFIDTAKAKLEHKINVIKLVLFIVPEIKQAWKNVQPAADFSLDDAVSEHLGLQLREHQFLNFMIHDGLNTEQMWRVIEAADQITQAINPAYAYSKDELEFIKGSGEDKNWNRPVNRITQEDIEFIRKSNRL